MTEFITASKRDDRSFGIRPLSSSSSSSSTCSATSQASTSASSTAPHSPTQRLTPASSVTSLPNWPLLRRISGGVLGSPSDVVAADIVSEEPAHDSEDCSAYRPRYTRPIVWKLQPARSAIRLTGTPHEVITTQNQVRVKREPRQRVSECEHRVKSTPKSAEHEVDRSSGVGPISESSSINTIAHTPTVSPPITTLSRPAPIPPPTINNNRPLPPHILFNPVRVLSTLAASLPPAALPPHRRSSVSASGLFRGR